MHVISIASQKGGVGKTTTTVNLAAAFRELGHDPLVIDLDSQMNATHWLMGRFTGEEEASVFDALTTVSTSRQDSYRLSRLVKTSELGVDFVQSGESMTELGLRETVRQKSAYPLQLRRRLEELQSGPERSYDLCLVDCPPSLGSPVVLALTASDDVIAPLTADNFSVQGLGQLFETVESVQSRSNPDLRVLGILVNNVDRRRGLADELTKGVYQNYGEHVFDTTIPWRAKIVDAGTLEKNLYDMRRSDAADLYTGLAEEIISRINSTAA